MQGHELGPISVQISKENRQKLNYLLDSGQGSTEASLNIHKIGSDGSFEGLTRPTIGSCKGENKKTPTIPTICLHAVDPNEWAEKKWKILQTFFFDFVNLREPLPKRDIIEDLNSH